MKNYAIFILFSLLTMTSETGFAVSMPTKASTPLPMLHETKNKDIVLQETVQQKLSHLAILRGQAVSASSKNGVITLEGSVESKNQGVAAIKAARSVKGVKKVKSRLTIKFLPRR